MCTWVPARGLLSTDSLTHRQIRDATEAAATSRKEAAAAGKAEATIRAAVERVVAARAGEANPPALALSTLHAAGGQMTMADLKAEVCAAWLRSCVCGVAQVRPSEPADANTARECRKAKGRGTGCRVTGALPDRCIACGETISCSYSALHAPRRRCMGSLVTRWRRLIGHTPTRRSCL